MYAIHIDRNIILQLLTACYEACYARGRIDILPATRHLDLCSAISIKVSVNCSGLMFLPRIIYTQNTGL